MSKELRQVLSSWEAYAFSTNLNERNDDLCKAITEITQAAANKAAEEGEMAFFLSDIYEICDEYAKFFASKERDDMSGAVYQVKSRFQHLASKKDEIAADRASCEVAAQAGQVAVPGWKLVPEVATPEMCDAVCESTNFASNVADQIYRKMISAAPSPAKESK